MRLLYAARGLRGFGDGFAVIILPAYLTAIGYSPLQIGIVATAALLGSSVLTLAVGFFAPRHDLRNLLLAGAGLIALTGLAFPVSEHIAVVLAVAFFGTINPSAGDSRRAGAARARDAGARRRRQRTHGRLCALQPDRRARGRGRLARRRHARFARARRHRAR